MSQLTEFRSEKDQFFRSDHQSPLLPEQSAAFAGLAYYEENPAVTFEVEPERFDDQVVVEMQTSTGDAASYVRSARIGFEVEGERAELTVYRDVQSGAPFMPFQDANAGGDTYGAGRYLDIHELPDGRLHIDFNYAYNPYCAYNERWSCPIPPAENRLGVALRAGERRYEGGH